MGCENSKAAEVKPINPPASIKVQQVANQPAQAKSEDAETPAAPVEVPAASVDEKPSKPKEEPTTAPEPTEVNEQPAELEVEELDPQPQAAIEPEKPAKADAPTRIRDALNAAITKEDSDKELLNAISTKEAMMDLWNAADYNGNGGCSLAELDAMAVAKSFNVSKPTLMRAYKKTIHRDGDGDDWVEKKEFPAFIVNAFFFEKLWGVFEDLDADDDRRIGLDEFTRGLAKLGVALTTEEAQAEFDKIDNNDGGMVLFSEFCKYAQAAVGVCAGVGDDDAWQAGSKPKA
eukprot:TRINITY_DN9148_c1_g1_i1.p1 TRINITY_DN9148_c1_g1~~TRINITY_DN9148_c1_g1_i1.p1  ORF type:complete len:289 (+),score=103.47 TRINITY_DN9148_c1_g1_i1:68-934(+)